MATQPQTHTKFSKATGGRLEWYPVTASAVIKKGDLLKIASSKVDQILALPGSDGTATASDGSKAIAAYAEENFTADSSGVSTDGESRTKMLVRVVDDSFRWETRGYDDGTDDAQAQGSFGIGTTYRFQRWRHSASDWWYEIKQTSTGEWMCENRSPNSSENDDFGINFFKPTFSATIRQLA